jgi:hypothetical protein
MSNTEKMLRWLHQPDELPVYLEDRQDAAAILADAIEEEGVSPTRVSGMGDRDRLSPEQAAEVVRGRVLSVSRHGATMTADYLENNRSWRLVFQF